MVTIFSSVFAVNIPYDLEIDTRDGSEALYVSEPWSGIRDGSPHRVRSPASSQRTGLLKLLLTT